jgi:hypothetical protein
MLTFLLMGAAIGGVIGGIVGWDIAYDRAFTRGLKAGERAAGAVDLGVAMKAATPRRSNGNENWWT